MPSSSAIASGALGALNNRLWVGKHEKRRRSKERSTVDAASSDASCELFNSPLQKLAVSGVDSYDPEHLERTLDGLDAPAKRCGPKSHLLRV